MCPGGVHEQLQCSRSSAAALEEVLSPTVWAFAPNRGIPGQTWRMKVLTPAGRSNQDAGDSLGQGRPAEVKGTVVERRLHGQQVSPYSFWMFDVRCSGTYSTIMSLTVRSPLVPNSENSRAERAASN